MDANALREPATDAIRYWEPRRLVYNGALFAIVLACFVYGYPSSGAALSVDKTLLLFILAVLANVAYCAAYVVDLFAQNSEYRGLWRRYRWVLFAIGLSFAGVLTRFWSLGAFLPTSR